MQRPARWLYPPLVAAILAAAILAACAGAPVLPPKPQSAAEGLYILEAESAVLLATAVDLRRSGILDDDAYRQFDRLWARARDGLDLAWAAYDGGDLGSLPGRLAAVRAVLLEARGLLHQGGGTGGRP